MKIGTVGTNSIVDTFIDAARLTGKADIACIYSRSKENASAFAQKHGISKWSTDEIEFLNDSDFDFIYVASPNSLHHSWAKQALLAGKNVICEKPFTSTKAELAELIDIAREKELYLFEALTIPHLPNYQLIAEMLHELGVIKAVQLNMSQYSSRYDAFLSGDNPNVFNPEYSGGALMDLNYYNINFLLGLFGRPEAYTYYPNLADNGIDTSGVIIMMYDGFVATSLACKDSASRNIVQIQGEKGFIEIPSASSTLIDGFTIHVKDRHRTIDEQVQKNPLYYELKDFAEIYADNDMKACRRYWEQSLLCMEIVENARKAAEIVFPADRQELI